MKKFKYIIEIKSTLSKKKMKITRYYYSPEPNNPLGYHCFYLDWDNDPTVHCGYCQHYHFSQKVYLWNTISFLDEFCKENVVFNLLQIDKYYSSYNCSNKKYEICKTKPTQKDNFEDLFFLSLDFVQDYETFFIFYCLMKKNKKIIL